MILISVFQLFFNVITLFTCVANRHGAGIKYTAQLDTNVGVVGLEIFIHAEESFTCSDVVNAKDGH